MRLFTSVTLLMLLSVGCGSNEPVPAEGYAWQHVQVSASEQKEDPIPTATKLIEQRETPGSLDKAIALLDWHVERNPGSAELHELLAQAHSRSAEMLDLNKPEDRSPHQHHRTEGMKHAEQALKLSPDSGAAHYWLAANMLHAADAERSLGRAKDALKQLDLADQLVPKIDDGGPSRLRGKVLSEMPGLFGGSTSKAIASYRRSLELAPDCITTHLWLGQAYLDAKKPDLARKELEWVVAAKPTPGHEKDAGEDKAKAQELLKKLETK
jgi:tetratricopeptide (TPR) repeat protein